MRLVFYDHTHEKINIIFKILNCEDRSNVSDDLCISLQNNFKIHFGKKINMTDINPFDEQKRLASLYSHQILDTVEEEDFDQLTELAAAICNTPIALISLVDNDRQWFKSHFGTDVRETDRCVSFCSHAIQEPDRLMQIEDARKDSRFFDNLLVTGDPHIRFYAGMPLVDEDGHALGSLCVIDDRARSLSEIQKKALQTLARQVADKLALRKKIRELESAHSALQLSENSLKLSNEKLEEGYLIQKKNNDELQIANIKLVNTEIRLQNILDTVGEGIGITDENGNIVYTNQRNREIFKLDEKSMLELNNCSAVWNNRRLDGTKMPDNEHPITCAVKTGRSVSDFEFMVDDGQGTSKYLRMNTTPIKDVDGKVTGAIGSFADITESYLLHESVKEKEEKMRMAVQSANLGTWYIDAVSRKFIPSQRLKELFGFNLDEEMPYESAVIQIAESHRDRVVEAVEMAIVNGNAYELEYPITGYHDKKLRWVRATGKLYTNSVNPEISHFSGTVADITERKLDEQRRSDFIGMVSHDLRNPLTAIGGYNYILGRRAKKIDDEIILGSVDKINSQLKRMESMIEGFLEVARYGDGKIHLQKTRFDMAELMNSSKEDMVGLTSSHQIIFEPSDHIFVEADRNKIEQVIINFINNAVKYSEAATIIKISCFATENDVVLSVSDQGMGIPPKDQPFIFDRFYRVENDAMQSVKGFGIGLYICKEIIESHQGKIGVESTIGKGSRFWFSLPINH